MRLVLVVEVVAGWVDLVLVEKALPEEQVMIRRF